MSELSGTDFGNIFPSDWDSKTTGRANAAGCPDGWTLGLVRRYEDASQVVQELRLEPEAPRDRRDHVPDDRADERQDQKRGNGGQGCAWRQAHSHGVPLSASRPLRRRGDADVTRFGRSEPQRVASSRSKTKTSSVSRPTPS